MAGKVAVLRFGVSDIQPALSGFIKVLPSTTLGTVHLPNCSERHLAPHVFAGTDPTDMLQPATCWKKKIDQVISSDMLHIWITNR